MFYYVIQFTKWFAVIEDCKQNTSAHEYREDFEEVTDFQLKSSMCSPTTAPDVDKPTSCMELLQIYNYTSTPVYIRSWLSWKSVTSKRLSFIIYNLSVDN